MVAAAFKAVLIFQTESGRTLSYPCTVSDVNSEYYVFPDGNNDVVLPSNLGTLALVDVQLSASGTDTTTADIYVNGKVTGEQIMNAGNLTTNLARQFMSAPMYIAPATRLRIKQNT